MLEQVHLKLVYSPSTPAMARPENAGFDAAAVERLGTAGDTLEVLDTSAMSESDRHELYLREAVAAAGNRYRVGRPFGSNNYKGQDFGGAVPALLVSSVAGERPSDVYPHEQRDGTVVTIAGYLATLD